MFDELLFSFFCVNVIFTTKDKTFYLCTFATKYLSNILIIFMSVEWDVKKCSVSRITTLGTQKTVSMDFEIM